MSSFFHKNYKGQPIILILDSGMGGLSVYTAIQQFLPHACYLYFFDNQAFPYGERSEIFIINRVISIIKTIENNYPLDLVIVACNTASVISLKILKKNFLFPIIGVVPAVKLASKLTKNGIIGILATRLTIQHSCILSLIQRFASEHKVMLLGTPELVNLAESKILGKKIPISMFRKILTPWIDLKESPDTIVLGCTHFSLLKEELITVLSFNVYLVDSIQSVVRYSVFLLSKSKINSTNQFCYRRTNKIYCSMDTAKVIKLKNILLSHYNFFSLEILSI